jgi:uncharacterized protein YxjI
MSESTAQPPAGWYPDPTAQFEQRYWDGAQWTEHVSSAGQQSTSPMQPMASPVTVSRSDKVRRQVEKAGVAPVTGGGTLFDSPVLVVNQKAKFVEVTNEYAVYDADGRQLGSVVEVGQSALRKVFRVVGNYDQYLSHSLEIRDAAGRVVLGLRRPAKFIKSKITVSTPDGREIGTIRQENAIGKIRFAFEVDGQRIGGIQAENWRAWNFAINDAQGQEVARITKKFAGLVRMMTTADNYVVQIHRPLEEPLRSLVIAAAVSVDTALKQDDR